MYMIAGLYSLQYSPLPTEINTHSYQLSPRDIPFVAVSTTYLASVCIFVGYIPTSLASTSTNAFNMSWSFDLDHELELYYTETI